MSKPDMSGYMEKLLEGIEVKWKPLDEVSIKISSGGTPKTGVSEYYDGAIPWLRTQEVNFGEIWETGVKITEAGVKSSSAKWIPENCVIVAMYGATVGKIGINKIPLTTNQACANIQLDEKIVDYRYVFHFLSSQYEYIKSLGAGSQTNINAGIVKKLQIPIPYPDNPEKSLEIQSEIVRILDAFTAMTAELTAELNLRKQQYNYYRDQLLSFEEGEVEWKTLGELCNFKNGFAFKSSLFREAGLPVVRITNINGSSVDLTNVKYFDSTDYKENFDNYIINKGDILIAMSGATTGKIGCFSSETPGYLNQRVGKFLPNKELLNDRFLYHFLLSKTESIYVLAGGGAQPNLSSRVLLEKLTIPIPCASDPLKSMAIQKEIAGILDRFDALINSITEGLPREIELRQKQYEYYRDLLLSFPGRKEEAVA